MKIHRPGEYHPATELEVMDKLLSPTNAKILELGCGEAWMTRKMVEAFSPKQIIATEVDHRQHEKNLLIDDLPQVTFVYGGAEKIDLPDGEVDLVIMLKSLHHVPMQLMVPAFAEIARVLRPGGLAYISEPVFDGPFNEVLRLFHDEQLVRQAAFEAIVKAVDQGLLLAESQTFFLSTSKFADFSEFERRILNVTHSDHQLEPALYRQVQEAFNAHMTPTGAEFQNPMRVDLLRKP